MDSHPFGGTPAVAPSAVPPPAAATALSPNVTTRKRAKSKEHLAGSVRGDEPAVGAAEALALEERSELGEPSAESEASSSVKLKPGQRFMQQRTGSWKDNHGTDSSSRDAPGRAFSRNSFRDSHRSSSSSASRSPPTARNASPPPPTAPQAQPPPPHPRDAEARASPALLIDELGEGLSEDFKRLFKQFDSDGDGRLGVAEFQRLMLHM